MTDDLQKRLREALIKTFRQWGGYWNVSSTPPGVKEAPADRWLLRIHCRPIARAELAADVVEAYLRDPSDPQAAARWQEHVRAVFEHAKATDELH